MKLKHIWLGGYKHGLEGFETHAGPVSGSPTNERKRIIAYLGTKKPVKANQNLREGAVHEVFRFKATKSHALVEFAFRNVLARGQINRSICEPEG